MRVFCLTVHAAYRCHDSGACCTSRWPIPIEAARGRQVEDAIRAGRLRANVIVPFVRLQEPAADHAAILGLAHDGACAFYEPGRRRCAIHAVLGHDALPAACQHFPRVCLVDAGGVSVTLSHYCPTAARLLFDTDVPLGVREAREGYLPTIVEGLDARGALPPLLHPRMLADRESYRRWEAGVVSLLGGEGLAEEALARIVGFTERVRRWEPGRGALTTAIDAALADAQTGQPGGPVPVGNRSLLHAAMLREDALVRRAVPSDLTVATPPPNTPDLFERLVAPRWGEFAGPVRRYLAARAFGNWCAYQGRGLRTVLRSVVAALCVLKVEAARHCGGAGRLLDETLLTEAFRSSDLILVHLASREDLARRLGGVEDGDIDALVDAVAGGGDRGQRRPPSVSSASS